MLPEEPTPFLVLSLAPVILMSLISCIECSSKQLMPVEKNCLLRSEVLSSDAYIQNYVEVWFRPQVQL